MNKIGEKLQDFFRKKGITQNDIAEELKVSQSYISSLLNDKKSFGKKQAFKWSELFGLSPNWLLTGEGEMLVSCSKESVDNNVLTKEEQLAQLGSESLIKVVINLTEESRNNLDLINKIYETNERNSRNLEKLINYLTNIAQTEKEEKSNSQTERPEWGIKAMEEIREAMNQFNKMTKDDGITRKQQFNTKGSGDDN